MLGAVTDAQVLTDLAGALAATDAVVAGIRAEQWPAPTPCTDLDVRAVLDHLVSGNLLFAAVVGGESPPDRNVDHLGNDPLTAFRHASERLREAFARPGVLESVYTAPFGTGPGADLARVRIVENLTHGWDLAHATAQSAAFPEDVAERALAAARRQLTARSAGRAAPFGPEVPVADDAPAIDRLAGFLGRAEAGRCADAG